jgi:ATP-dependent Clp protease ATP-binding subunit ClpA
MGLLREGDGVAARLLKNLDIDIEQTRQEILKELDPNFVAQEESGKAARMRAELPQRDDAPKFAGGNEGSFNFTPRAQQALANARREADRLKHNFVSAEHLLLGLLKLGTGVAVNVLPTRGVSLELAREKVEQLVGKGAEPKVEGNIPYTPQLKKALAASAKEASALNHTYVGTEHLLLGLMRDGDGIVVQVLRKFGEEPESIRREILKELDPNR